MRARLAVLMMAGSAALGGCAYGAGGYGSPFGGLSVGVSSGYGGYGGYGGYDPFCRGYGGYGSYGLGYGGYGGYDPYGFPVGGYGYGSRYGGYGSRYGGYGYGGRCLDPYWGWNDGFYYPGTGFYVYDMYRRPFMWSDAQRRYWSERRQKAEAVVGTGDNKTSVIKPNWEDFSRDRAAERAARVETRQGNRADRRQQVQTRVDQRQADRTARSTARTTTTERSTTRSTAAERRAERRSAREERRSARDDD